MTKVLNNILHADLNAEGFKAYADFYLQHKQLEAERPTYEQIGAISNWTESNKKGLMLAGNVGSGKTTLARMTMNYIAMQSTYQESIMAEMGVVTAKDLVLYAMQDYPATILKYSTKKCLMIDDLGNEPKSINVYGNVLMPVVDVIERIYELDKVLIITTNLDTDAIRQKYGERVYDRMKEMMYIVTFNNNSYRR